MSRAQLGQMAQTVQQSARSYNYKLKAVGSAISQPAAARLQEAVRRFSPL